MLGVNLFYIFAGDNENIDMIKTLLTNKYIDVNIKDKQGKKPIDYTITSEIKKLLKHWINSIYLKSIVKDE